MFGELLTIGISTVGSAVAGAAVCIGIARRSGSSAALGQPSDYIAQRAQEWASTLGRPEAGPLLARKVALGRDMLARRQSYRKRRPW